MVLPDVATCADCMREVDDPGDRRAGYVFTNCTNCGPRFSIIRRLPYDRPNTSMAGFELCGPCRAEYENPSDRRFHAQPTACPDCGPRLWLQEGGPVRGGRRAGSSGAVRASHGDAGVDAASMDAEDVSPATDPIDALVARLLDGAIVALKGIGGFLLLADATDEEVVAELRRRKDRPTKPFACMVADLDMAASLCDLDDAEAELLAAHEAPIVLLRRRDGAALAAGVAPGNPRVGLMLPTTPLHHLVARRAGRPLIATSGNLADEPICIDNDEARDRLGAIADLFLLHDRPIVRHVDDSVTWVLAGEPQVLRRARGLAPLPVSLRDQQPSVLAVGAHLKNAVALGIRDQVFISQHIGDMETAEAVAAFEHVIADFIDLYDAPPRVVAHDLHPDYAATRWALAAVAGNTGPEAVHGLPTVAVQHHHAHLASCLAEHGVQGAALGVIWDGVGLGTDGTVWGGEILLGDAGGYRRVARLRPFPLPGGDAAARDPRRATLAMINDIDPGLREHRNAAVLQTLAGKERDLLLHMIERGLNTPLSSSAGRLFDAAAAITGVGGRVSFEGEAAMCLEFAAAGGRPADYELAIETVAAPIAPDGAAVGEEAVEEIIELDWRPLIGALLRDAGRGVAVADMAAGFHAALVDAVVAVIERGGARQVALSGGCFQNRLLQEALLQRLPEVGCSVLIQRQVPPNDGGISLGQAVIAAARLQRADDSASKAREGD
jgi:hydrogenase maturation protein HypF